MNAPPSSEGDAEELASKLVKEHLAKLPQLQADSDPEVSPFEAIVSEYDLPFDAIEFSEQFRRRIRAVGKILRVEKGGTERFVGTGFLVGPSQILTNYHVLPAAPDGALAGGGKFRFRLESGRDGAPSPSFDIVRVEASSPPASKREEIDAMTEAPVVLDFALASLSAAAPPEAGFVDLNDFRPPVIAEPVFILQHPRGVPIRLGVEKVQGASLTRVRYLAPTERGSSGSPVFNKEMKLVALHHMGDPTKPPKFNQGVMAEAIVDALRKRKIPLAGPAQPTSAVSSIAPGATGLEAFTSTQASHRPRAVPFLAGGAVLLLLALGKQGYEWLIPDPKCPEGQVLDGKECKPKKSPAKIYAACIRDDGLPKVSSSDGSSIKTALAQTTEKEDLSDVRGRVEKSIRASDDRCLVLDISARCYAQAADTTVPPLPSSCTPPPATVTTDTSSSSSSASSSSSSSSSSVSSSSSTGCTEDCGAVRAAANTWGFASPSQGTVTCTCKPQGTSCSGAFNFPLGTTCRRVCTCSNVVVP